MAMWDTLKATAKTPTTLPAGVGPLVLGGSPSDPSQHQQQVQVDDVHEETTQHEQSASKRARRA